MSDLINEKYKEVYDLLSPAFWNEQLQKWDYSAIPEKDRIFADAAGGKVSREVMAKLHQWFPDRPEDEHANKPIYSANDLNQFIRFALAQNYKKSLI